MDSIYLFTDSVYNTRWTKREMASCLTYGHLTDKFHSLVARPHQIDHFTVVCLVDWPLNASEAVVLTSF